MRRLLYAWGLLTLVGSTVMGFFERPQQRVVVEIPLLVEVPAPRVSADESGWCVEDGTKLLLGSCEPTIAEAIAEKGEE